MCPRNDEKDIMGHKYKKPAKPSVANGGKHRW